MEIYTITRKDVSEVVAMLAKAFSDRETLAVHLKQSESIMSEVILRTLMAGIDDDLSFLVRLNDKVVGASIGRRLDSAPPYLEDIPNTWVVNTLFKRLEIPENLRKNPTKVVKGGHLGALSVEVGGVSGIGRLLIEHTLSEANRRGFEHYIATLTTPTTQHIYLDRLGFTANDEIIYSECGIDGIEHLPGKVILASIKL